MTRERLPRAFAAAVAVLFCACATPVAERLIVVSDDHSYGVTVPVSRLVLVLPKDGLVQKESARGHSDAERYFYFSDGSRNLIASGWFEPDREFPGVSAQWSRITEGLKKKGLPEPRAVQVTKLGGWDAMFYELSLPGIASTNVFAEWVQAGTWIELHASISSPASNPDDRAKLERFLGSLEVVAKPEGT